ncbi:HERC2, partial [Symbiodinium sp. CCMP2592]
MPMRTSASVTEDRREKEEVCGLQRPLKERLIKKEAEVREEMRKIAQEAYVEKEKIEKQLETIRKEEEIQEAEAMQAVESLIRVLVRSKNLVVVTSRPLLSGRSALESDPELILTMRLESLSDEQKRMVAYARLGAEGIEAYDKLLARLRSSQNVSDQGEEAASDGAEDVFGNPMMLSMLLCYLQTMAKKYAEKKETEGEEYAAEAKEEETTLTAVYRVAVDVMLQRVQARTQSDRWLLQERVDQSKQILQIMAMAMQTSRRAELRVEE